MKKGTQKCNKQKNLKSGFTLLELLIVVLIIGILATIALPQYKMAVLKSRFATIKNKTRAIYDAEQRYYLVHGSYTKNLGDLDINISNTDCSLNNISAYVVCNLRDKKNNILLQYIIMTQTGKLRCDAFPGDPNTLTNKICQAETGKNTPSNGCSTNFCKYYYN